MRRSSYLFREALTNVLTNRTTTLVAVATTAFTFACVGVFLLLYVNLNAMAASLERDIQILVYLEDTLGPGAVALLEQRLKADPAVDSLAYISKDQALVEFQKQFPLDSHLLQGLGQNPLPASYVVTLAPPFRTSEGVKRWAERVRTITGVDQVQYSQDWIDALGTLVRYIEVAAMIVGIILSAACVTIIANTIRLALYARREEIEILGMIGATKAFIRIPYVLEGSALGFAGSALSLVILKAGFELFRHEIRSTSRFLGVDSLLVFFPLPLCVGVVGMGVFLGFAGSYLSLLRCAEGRV
jgi:cell division transport system permease protein